MAGVRQTTPRATPKLRERTQGAAVPLDETDKRLMNLLQSSFPLDPRPFAGIAAQAELSEDEVLSRTQYLLEQRIIREITPIFDTPALGYRSMLVAAKVDDKNPHRARPSSTSIRASRTTTCATTSSTSGSRSRFPPTRSWASTGRSTCWRA